MISFKKILGAASALALLFIIIPIIWYCCSFGTELSNDKEVWAQFSDFLNVFVSIANLLLVTALTYSIYIYQREDESNKSIPMLIFMIEPETGMCLIKNIGKGPALNVQVSYKKPNNDWEKPTKIYSFPEGSGLKLDWFDLTGEYIAVYSDYLENDFTSICKDEDTRFYKKENHLKGKFSDYYKLREKTKKVPSVDYW